MQIPVLPLEKKMRLAVNNPWQLFDNDYHSSGLLKTKIVFLKGPQNDKT